MKIHPRYSNILFAGMLSLIMVTLVSGTVVLVNQGYGPDFFPRWRRSFATAWPVAFLTALAVAPIVRRVVTRLTAP